ncbi:MAG: IS110 family transposase [Tannerella sp.]|jgi:transposase|nr:IS110 family transposase [Tannerella sp.]
MKKFIIGIDVSKEKLDFCIKAQEVILDERVVENSSHAIKNSLKELSKTCKFSWDEVLICAEYTSQYTYPLCCVCVETGIDLWLENPAQIKYRSGIERGKNDRLDARKIAAYALRFEDRVHLFSLPEKTIGSLKQMISERDMYMVDKAKYTAQLTDQKRFMDKKDWQKKSKRLEGLIEGLKDAMEEIEKEMDTLIKADQRLSRQRKLLCSIEGVGERTAIKMIVETNAFLDFDNPRKFCCHAGVAPFEYRSGSSIRSRCKVSKRADMSIKALLHMAAMVAATRMSGELHVYYLKKVAEGKSKMSVLNAVRAKLVHRMFAVIKNNILYEKNYANPLA